MSNEKYNGWTNYATWRVNLEIIEDIDLSGVDYDFTADMIEEIVEDVEAALWCIKNIVAPQLARIKGISSPCVKAGRCVDCHGPERICNVTTILERAPTYTGVTVVLVDQDLGLSWAENWSQERKDHIAAECDALTWLRRRPKPLI